MVQEARAKWTDLALEVTANHDRYESLSFPYRVVGPNYVRLLQPKKR